jgi:spermidine synthase
VHPEVRRIVICEIEPRVVGAASGYFSEANHAVLSDPRVEVIEDDARHFLATTREKFDVITSDPIHPWVRGNSILFSREYYEIVKQRLNPGGVATQWVPLYETSAEAVKIQMRTFFDAFPGGTVWNSRAGGVGYDVVLLGQAEPTRIALDGVQERIDRNPRLQASLAEVGLGTAVDLLASYATRAADLGEWLEGTPVNRDLSLKLEYLSGLALNLQLANRIYASMVASRRYPHDLFAATPEEHAQLRQRILKPFSPAAGP